MVNWDVAINVFMSGIVGVMVVMALLQVSIQVFSKLISLIEKRDKNNNVKAQKSV